MGCSVSKSNQNKVVENEFDINFDQSQCQIDSIKSQNIMVNQIVIREHVKQREQQQITEPIVQDIEQDIINSDPDVKDQQKSLPPTNITRQGSYENAIAIRRSILKSAENPRQNSSLSSRRVNFVQESTPLNRSPKKKSSYKKKKEQLMIERLTLSKLQKMF